jgi:hypothetical protein
MHRLHPQRRGWMISKGSVAEHVAAAKHSVYAACQIARLRR